MTKTYLCMKTVIATPMTRGAYNDYRQWTLPPDEDGADDGYLVEDTDGGTPNTLRHAGYISWSPEDVFERSYKPFAIPVKCAAGLQPHQSRVIDEKAELDARLTELAAFVKTPLCLDLPFEERDRLSRQFDLMKRLSAVLGERVEAFK